MNISDEEYKTLLKALKLATDNEHCKHGSLICWNQCHECSDEEDEQGDKDKRIAELEAALAKCAWHSHIEELEEDAQKFHDDMEKYKADNARLRELLKQIADIVQDKIVYLWAVKIAEIAREGK